MLRSVIIACFATEIATVKAIKNDKKSKLCCFETRIEQLQMASQQERSPCEHFGDFVRVLGVRLDQQLWLQVRLLLLLLFLLRLLVSVYASSTRVQPSTSSSLRPTRFVFYFQSQNGLHSRKWIVHFSGIFSQVFFSFSSFLHFSSPSVLFSWYDPSTLPVSMSPLAFVLMCQYSGNFFVQLIYYILAEYVLEKFDRPPPEQELFLDWVISRTAGPSKINDVWCCVDAIEIALLHSLGRIRKWW